MSGGGRLGLVCFACLSLAAACKPQRKAEKLLLPHVSAALRSAAPPPSRAPLVPVAGCTAARADKIGDWEPTAADVIKAGALAILECIEPPLEKLTRCAESVDTGLLRISAELPITDCSPKAQPC